MPHNLIPESQKLVKKDSPPNINFFPMTTRRMAWLLSAVVEPQDFTHTQPTAAAGGDGYSTDQAENEDQKMVLEEEDSGGRYDAADSDDSYEGDAGDGEAMAKKLAIRKRAASFLHQLLITVKTREIFLNPLLFRR